MLQQKSFGIVCFLAISIPSGRICAEEPSATRPPVKSSQAATTPASTETVDQLIEQLDAADFTKREAACGKLLDKGQEAIPALEKVAVKGDLEVSSRSLRVLDKLMNSSEENISKAAEDSLQRLRDGDSPAARKAKSILDKKNGTSNNNNNPFQFNGGMMPGGGFGGGRIIINGGMLQIGGAATKSISVSNNNGVRHIKATDGDKTVKIDDDPTNGIKIECTDKVDGKEVTKKYDAKNVEELKKKQPEGYKIYKEYGERQGNLGALQVQIGANPIPIQIPALQAPMLQPAIPIQPPIPAPVPPVLTPPSSIQVDVATRLKIISDQLESLRKNESLKDASAEKKAELKKQIDELTQAMAELRKQLDTK